MIYAGLAAWMALPLAALLVGLSEIALVCVATPCILAPFLIYPLWNRQLRRTFLPVVFLLLLIGFSVMTPVREKLLVLQMGGFTFEIPRAKGLTVIYNAEQMAFYQQAIQYVRNQTTPGDKIFVGNLHHDIGFWNDGLFYFLAERKAATRYALLEPSLLAKPHIQREIIQDIERSRVYWVILRDNSRDYREPNLSGRSSGVMDLDHYIRRTFQPVREFGEYSILRRRVAWL